jgi:integrase/recombinase XerC
MHFEIIWKRKKSIPFILSVIEDLENFSEYNEIHFGQNTIDHVNYSQIRAWIVSCDAGISNVSVNRKFASLKAFYKFLLKIKQITVSHW